MHIHPPTPLVTALYGRVSKEDRDRMSIEIQQYTLRNWAETDQLVASVYGEYWDDGVSGKIPLWERPNGKRLVEDLKAGQVQAVAAVYCDRFGRTVLDGLKAAAFLEEQKAKIVFILEGWDSRRGDSPMYFQMRLVMAEEEHRRIKERTTNGRLRAMDRDNAPPCGVIQTGYRLDPDRRGQLLEDPDEGPIVRRMFEMILEDHSQSDILAWLRTTKAIPGRKYQARGKATEGVSDRFQARSHKSSEWSLSTIARILSNRVYVGERKWKGRIFPAPALVDLAVFNAVQERMERQNRPQRSWRGREPLSLLSGKLKCGLCGGKFYYAVHRTKHTTATGQKTYATPYYLCENGRQTGVRCNAKKLRVDDTDAWTWEAIEQFIRDPQEVVKRVLAADDRLGREDCELKAEEEGLLASVAALETEVQEIWAMQKQKDLPLSWVQDPLTALNVKRVQAVKQLEEVRRRRNLTGTSREHVVQATQALASVRDLLEHGLTMADKVKIVNWLLDGGVVSTDTEGWAKESTLELHLRWGESLEARQGGRGGQSLAPQLANAQSFATSGADTLVLATRCSRRSANRFI